MCVRLRVAYSSGCVRGVGSSSSLEVVDGDAVHHCCIKGEVALTWTLACPYLAILPPVRTGIRKGGGATATFDSCACCVIKPHAVKAGNVGKIIDKIFDEVKIKAYSNV